MNRERNRALVHVPERDLHKLAAHGLILPDGYEVVDRTPFVQHETMSMVFLVEGPADEIPYSAPATVLPSLYTLSGYDAIVVERSS